MAAKITTSPGGGGGGSLPLEAVTDAREKKRVKKGVKNAKNGRKGYPNRYDQNSSHAIKRGKGSKLRQSAH